MKIFVKKHFADKKALLFFTSLAITGGKMLATFKSLFSKKETPVSPGKPLNTAIAAGQQKFDECLQLLKHAVPPLAIAGRIAVNNVDNGTALGRIQDIENVLSKNNIEQLIFCEKEQSFKTIIQQAETINGKAEMLFHAAGSRSIVGSSNKNRQGKFISKPATNGSIL